jgi:hypothetical protein
MRATAVVCNVAALAACLYDGKILVWDIAVADLRAGSGGVAIVVFAVVVTAAFVMLPLAGGLRWALMGRTGAAMLAALVSLALSGGGFAILAAAFIP